jgi:hypothetical protein
MAYYPIKTTQVGNDGPYSKINSITLSNPSHERCIIFCCYFRKKGKNDKGKPKVALRNFPRADFDHI